MEISLACPNCGASAMNEDKNLVIDQQVALKCQYCGSEWLPGENNDQPETIKPNPGPVATPVAGPAENYVPPPPGAAAKVEKKLARIITMTVCFICAGMAVICLLVSISIGMKGWGVAVFFALASLIFWRVSRFFK